MAADDVGHKKYGESCPWLYGRGLTGRRTAAGSSVSVEVPSGKKRAFVAATTTAGTPKAKEKLRAWRRGVERVTGPNTSLGVILGRNGEYCLKRGAGEKAVFLFKNHMLYTTKAHVMGLETLCMHVLTPRDRPK